MDWRECCSKRIVKEVSLDNEMIESLIKTSKDKSLSEQKLEMSEITAVSKLSLAYDSLRELLEALALQKGYKIYNHECYTAFLKEILEEDENAEVFDEIRKIRNAVNYYGKPISVEKTKEVILKINGLRVFVSGLLEMID